MVQKLECEDIIGDCVPGTSFNVGERLEKTASLLDHYIDEGTGEFLEATQSLQNSLNELRDCLSGEDSTVPDDKSIPRSNSSASEDEQSNNQREQPQDILDKLENFEFGGSFDLMNLDVDVASFSDFKSMLSQLFGADPSLRPAMLIRQAERLKGTIEGTNKVVQDLGNDAQKAIDIANELGTELDFRKEARNLAECRFCLEDVTRKLEQSIGKAQEVVQTGEQPLRLALENAKGEAAESPETRDVAKAVQKTRQGATMESVANTMSHARDLINELQANKLLQQLDNMANRILEGLEQIQSLQNALESVMSTILAGKQDIPHDPAKASDSADQMREKIENIASKFSVDFEPGFKEQANELLKDVESTAKALAENISDLEAKCERFNEISDAAGLDFASGDLMGSVASEAIDMLANPQRILSELIGVVKDMFNKPGEVIKSFFNALRETANEVYGEFSDFVSDNSDKITSAFDQAVDELGDEFDKYFGKEGEVEELIENIGDTVSDLIDNAQSLIENSEFGDGVGEDIKDLVDQICNNFKDFRDNDLPPLETDLNDFLDDILSKIDEIKNEIPNLDQSIVNEVEDYVNDIETTVEDIKNSANDKFQTIKDTTSDICDNTEDIKSAIDKISALGNPIDDITGFFSSGYNQSKSLVNSVYSKSGEYIDRAYEGLQNLASSSSAGQDDAQANFTDILNSISQEGQDFITEELPKMVSSLTDIFSGMQGKITDLVGRLTPLLTKVTNFLGSVSFDIPDNAMDKASQVLDSISQPIQSLFSGMDQEMPALTDVTGLLDLDIGKCMIEMPDCQFEILSDCSVNENIGGNKTIQNKKSAERVKREAERQKHKASDGKDKLADAQDESKRHKSNEETIASDMERLARMAEECLNG